MPLQLKSAKLRHWSPEILQRQSPGLIAIVATSQPLINQFKIDIAKHIDITNLGKLHWILRIEVHQICENHSILLSQCSYLDSILRHYGFEDLKPVSLPMETSTHLMSTQSPLTTDEFACMWNIPYHEAMRSLMYTSLGMHPNITYAVQALLHFSKNPGFLHWDAIK
jgi:hypothetical protein